MRKNLSILLAVAVIAAGIFFAGFLSGKGNAGEAKEAAEVAHFNDGWTTGNSDLIEQIEKAKKDCGSNWHIDFDGQGPAEVICVK